MRHSSLLLFFSITVAGLALSIPINPSIIQLPSQPGPTASLSSIPVHGFWPPVPWTYRDGTMTDVFSDYGRNANSTLSQSILFSTLNMETIIIKGPASYRTRSVAFRDGIVHLYIAFSGKVEVTKEEIFRMLDQWRVYAGAFGPREIAQGVIMERVSGVQAASFTIRFDQVDQ
ncbi:hypothetical protein ACLMJK_002503 [Lecanora helva]